MLESPTPTGAGAAEDAPSGGTTPHAATSTQPGLRERKKQQTRARIIEVALELCDAQGFEATTVEQIADAANVSPRTINRYFDTKEDIVLGPIPDFGIAVANALREQPHTGDELGALCEAFLQTIDLAAAGTDRDVSFRQFQQMQRISHRSPSVSTRSLDYTDSKNAAISRVLAERLGTEPDALAVRLIVGTWQMLGNAGMLASHETILRGDPETVARSTRASLTAACAEFRRTLCGTDRTEPR